ncbi:hypothetical protein JM93_03044 [Roseibium hamelinense]|uniref:DUF4124 domain-containing protein n=2 Tax=Roseibium hamelinense TaxID=150831 RepID=A0A562SVI7_9HYPH|nr:hypothetical protein [Roseibium hamelinense]MTI42405.1 hypothetical protein [Roseibium hamelinense]TWI84710.1 hypothetical protein JM93_03044 [Roseibium hamelinense]
MRTPALFAAALLLTPSGPAIAGQYNCTTYNDGTVICTGGPSNDMITITNQNLRSNSTGSGGWGSVVQGMNEERERQLRDRERERQYQRDLQKIRRDRGLE